MPRAYGADDEPEDVNPPLAMLLEFMRMLVLIGKGTVEAPANDELLMPPDTVE